MRFFKLEPGDSIRILNPAACKYSYYNAELSKAISADARLLTQALHDKVFKTACDRTQISIIDIADKKLKTLSISRHNLQTIKDQIKNIQLFVDYQQAAKRFKKSKLRVKHNAR